MADMKAAALKAWNTRRERYGDSGLKKKTEKPEQAEKPNCKKAGKQNGRKAGKPEQAEAKTDKNDS